ncbi:MAG: hypothetical protein WAV89_16070 [Ignavibacteriaceae bacterium]
MRSFLTFAGIQLIVYIFGMSDAVTISLILLGAAVSLFAGAYFFALLKDRQHRRKSGKAILNLQ